MVVGRRGCINWVEAVTTPVNWRQYNIRLDYARSPLVDDQAPRTENLARLERLRSFHTAGTRVVRADRRFALVELAPGPAQATPVRPETR